MKTTKILAIMVLGLGFMVCQACLVEAAPMGTAFTYQGRLLDANDPADGEYDFQFKLFDAPNGGVQQGSTVDVNDLDVIDGYFTVELDFGASVFDGNDRWLQIGVRQVANPFTILSPRQEVTPTPYALYAASGPGVPVPLDLSGSVAYPGAVIKGTNTGTGYGVYGKHDGSGNFGYLGYSNRGVYGYSYSDYGVRGYGGSYGVYGLSSDGYGVYGESTNSYGVYGKNHSSGNFGYLGGDLYGVYGSSDIIGVFGGHSLSGNFGYLGTNLHGVYGVSSSGYGVYGLSDSGHGVYGKHNTSGNYGSLGGDSYGVYGLHAGSGNIGWLGSNNSGVFGYSVSDYAGYFNGNVYVTKDVSALSFTDRTPYPKDLATAYEAVMSMERLPDGQYDENNKQVQLDHSKLSDFIKYKDGNRDLSATVSCHNEVLKDLIRKQQELGKAHIYIEQLHKQNRDLETRLVKLEMTVARLNVSQKGAIK